MYTLEAVTLAALVAYKQQVARLNNAPDPSAPFAVARTIEQKLVEVYSQQTDFLSRINIQTVGNAHGQKLGLGGNKTAASTTDTRIQPRRPTDLTSIEAIDDYLCTQTDYDIAYLYEIIDNWGYLPDFQKKMAELAVKTIAQDKQRIGFNGTHRAKTSNRELYPMLNDVNTGWLEKMRYHNAERHISGITIGANQEFKNIDGLVEMAINHLIGEQHQQGDDLVAITSRNMVSDKYVGLINQSHSPTEQAAANALYQKQQLGTLPVDTPSFMLPSSILITSYDNLSIYMQKGTMRRFLKDEPEWNRTTDYQSVSECYVVEDYSKAVLLENVVVEA